MTHWLLIIVAACITWTVTKEEIFLPLREWLHWRRHRLGVADAYYLGALRAATWRERVLQKLLYMPTCDYCFAHWVVLALVLVVQPAPLAGTGVVGWGLTYFALVAGTAALTTLFGIVRQVQRVLTEVRR